MLVAPIRSSHLGMHLASSGSPHRGMSRNNQTTELRECLHQLERQGIVSCLNQWGMRVSQSVAMKINAIVSKFPTQLSRVLTFSTNQISPILLHRVSFPRKQPAFYQIFHTQGAKS